MSLIDVFDRHWIHVSSIVGSIHAVRVYMPDLQVPSKITLDVAARVESSLAPSPGVDSLRRRALRLILCLSLSKIAARRRASQNRDALKDQLQRKRLRVRAVPRLYLPGLASTRDPQMPPTSHLEAISTTRSILFSLEMVATWP